MQVYQGKNYATGGEVADVLGMGEQPEANTCECFNPIEEIVSSSNRGKRVLSRQDMATLRNLKENPPKPTPELVSGLREMLTDKG